MLLNRLKVTNFRCYQECEFTSLAELVIFIGENDSGKTVIMDAIAVLVAQASIGVGDIPRDTDKTQPCSMVIEGEFTLDEHDTLPDQYRVGENKNRLYLRRTFVVLGTAISPTTEVKGLGFEDARYDNFRGRNVQIELLREQFVAPAGREEDRLAQLEALVTNGTLRREEKLLNIASGESSSLSQHLPTIERITATDYREPQSIIQRVLQKRVASILAPIDEATRQPIEIMPLREVRQLIVDACATEMESVLPIVQRHHVKVQSIQTEPNIDFARSVSTTPIVLDCGSGKSDFSSYGEGTKKRVWMGLLQWERSVSSQISERSIIRMYDEPDTNLHFQAQRQLFTMIRDLSKDQAARTQCIVSTHSIPLIDRAPAQSINMIVLDHDNKRSVARIANSEADPINFFSDMGHALGLSNSILLYERSFLIVEGESEKSAIPVIYKNLHGSSMREDGIVVVNLYTCSAWKAVLQMLLGNRISLVHLLLDQDCTSPDSSANITTDVLTEIGCDTQFLANQVTFIGTKEFEDSFSNEVLLSAMNRDFPREDETLWLDQHIDDLRLNGLKFSEDLCRVIRTNCTRQLRCNAKKPGVANSIAEQCQTRESIPQALVTALDKVRGIAGDSRRLSISSDLYRT